MVLSAAGLAHAAQNESAQASKPETAAASRQIDALLAADWKKEKLTGNAPAKDEVLVRRLYLDIVGRIPTYRETEEFFNDKSTDKRAKLIDKLLASEGYAQHFFNFWADILRAQTRPQNGGGISGVAYTNFIKDSLRANKPYDQFVREMVSAQGKAWESGQIGYYMRDRNMPLDNMAATVRVFLGTRIECAQCHNHPFDKWTQMQFYQMAAFTYGVESNDYSGGPMAGVNALLRTREKEMREKKQAANGGKIAATVKGDMEAYRMTQRHLGEALQRVRDPLRYTMLSFHDKKLQLPHDYKYPDAKPNEKVTAATMMGQPVEAKSGTEGLDAYAAWVTSKENPRFTNLVANRLWKKVFGMGLIEPVDELMDNTVAMNPDLMKYLEKYMLSVNYDMKAYLRTLFNTQTYQRSVLKEEVPAGIAYHFTGPVLRRMSAEQMWDSFVALINPTPDMPNLVTRETDEKRIAVVHKLNDALESLAPEEMLKGAEVAAIKYAEQSSRLKEIQEQIVEVRKNNDKEKLKDLFKQSNELQRTALKSVNDNIFVPAVLKLAANVNSKEKTDAAKGDANAGAVAPAEAGSMMMMGGDVEANMSKIPIAGYDKPKKSVEQIQAELDEQRKQMLDEAAYFGLTEEKKIKNYVTARQATMRQWLRSAEMESPAPRGHYLREFGQSDREMIENSNSDASVPQALALMNSELLPQIMSTYSALTLSLNKKTYPDEKFEAAYVTLLSRKPTENEKHVWLEALDKGVSTMDDLIFALMNTQQFIFIQ